MLMVMVLVTGVKSQCFFSLSQARANVTMHLGLTYDSSRNCDESPYKVTVCIGHKLDK